MFWELTPHHNLHDLLGSVPVNFRLNGQIRHDGSFSERRWDKLTINRDAGIACIALVTCPSQIESIILVDAECPGSFQLPVAAKADCSP
jgi:hypothetical protein